jgi:hypothetical protein
MKQARKVTEALEVQSQLAGVRTEIERLEGRRRFLEKQAVLSTITAVLTTPLPVIATTKAGVWEELKGSISDGLRTATEIVLGLIHIVLVMTPIMLLIGRPGWLLFKWFRRHPNWSRRTAAVNAPPPDEEPAS